MSALPSITSKTFGIKTPRPYKCDIDERKLNSLNEIYSKKAGLLTMVVG
jgi:hypothetical protein